MTPVVSKKLALAFTIRPCVEPNKNTTPVFTNMYKESNPKILGVKIWLLVTV